MSKYILDSQERYLDNTIKNIIKSMKNDHIENYEFAQLASDSDLYESFYYNISWDFISSDNNWERRINVGHIIDFGSNSNIFFFEDDLSRPFKFSNYLKSVAHKYETFQRRLFKYSSKRFSTLKLSSTVRSIMLCK